MNTMSSTATASKIANRDGGVVCAVNTWSVGTVAAFAGMSHRGITMTAIDSKRFTDSRDMSSPLGITDGV